MYLDLRKILQGCKSKDWGPTILFPRPHWGLEVGGMTEMKVLEWAVPLQQCYKRKARVHAIPL